MALRFSGGLQPERLYIHTVSFFINSYVDGKIQRETKLRLSILGICRP